MNEQVGRNEDRRTIASIFGVILLSFILIEGQYIFHDLRERQRVETDPHAVGHVVSVEPTGETIWGDSVSIVGVEFETQDGQSIQTSSKERITSEDSQRFQNDSTVDVWYDRDHPTDVVVRWRR